MMSVCALGEGECVSYEFFVSMVVVVLVVEVS